MRSSPTSSTPGCSSTRSGCGTGGDRTTTPCRGPTCVRCRLSDRSDRPQAARDRRAREPGPGCVGAPLRTPRRCTPTSCGRSTGTSRCSSTSRPTATDLPAAFFDASYARRSDPWYLAERWYERRKRAATLAAIPDERVGTALEVGCSIGVLTEQLAPRCERLVATDVAPAALAQAKDRTAHLPNVELVEHDVAQGVPGGPYDLVVLSEVAYYLTSAHLRRLVRQVEDSLTETGTLVACHWRHPVRGVPADGGRRAPRDPAEPSRMRRLRSMSRTTSCSRCGAATTVPSRPGPASHEGADRARGRGGPGTRRGAAHRPLPAVGRGRGAAPSTGRACRWSSCSTTAATGRGRSRRASTSRSARSTPARSASPARTGSLVASPSPRRRPAGPGSPAPTPTRRCPPQWLTCQLALAQRGADVVVGTVRPDPSDLTAAEHRAWSATRVPGRPNGHVHGANLGIRADAYLRAGGFLPQDEHEDVDLVAAHRT